MGVTEQFGLKKSIENINKFSHFIVYLMLKVMK